MKTNKWMALAAALAVGNAAGFFPASASLFKIDFGHIQNEKELLDAEGSPNGLFPPLLVDWNVIPTWTFADPIGSVTPDSVSLKGTANADGTAVTWQLIDASSNPKKNVTLTIMDNKALVESLNPDSPPYMLGQTHNDPVPARLDVVYDGVNVPRVVKDDYLYRAPDVAGTESLMRFANLEPGTYTVTVFEGRTSDGDGRYGKVWVDDITGAKEPATQNTGNYAGNDNGTLVYKGQPRTTTVTIKAGEYLWFAEMEDNSGGISGMIIRSQDPIDSPGLFKIDFGQSQNDNDPQLDPEGNPVGTPEPLKDWNVIPTWTYASPNDNVVAGSASISGTANADGTEVTWKLTDFSKAANKNVTMTIKDNKALAEQLSPDAPPYMVGGTANNPVPQGIAIQYDGVLVPASVKDDYIYRLPDAAGSESLMRFAGLTPGKYNVTVFEGRTSDNDGRHGKIWVDDITGAKEPASQNTGNYAGNDGGTAVPLGQPRTITVDIKAGEYLWFAEMEDNSGGVSGIIIRGVGAAPASVELLASATVGGTYATVAGAQIDAAAKSIKVPASGAAQFFRVKGTAKINSATVSGGVLEIKYQ
jgi:uncharacterized protein (DUF2141 family)